MKIQLTEEQTNIFRENNKKAFIAFLITTIIIGTISIWMIWFSNLLIQIQWVLMLMYLSVVLAAIVYSIILNIDTYKESLLK